MIRRKAISTGRQGAAERGFTMIEIAISLAVVGFALVAIMGILPTGMTVQKDNREDTLMGQEGRYWLEAIKNGAQGLDALTNHVEELQVVIIDGNTKPVTNILQNTPQTPFTAETILAILTQPKFPVANRTNLYQRITARVRPITGNASELFYNNSTNSIGFRYEIQSEFTPEVIFPIEAETLFTNANTLISANVTKGLIRTNLHNLRLTLRYPLVERGNGWAPGSGRKSFRAKVAGAKGANGVIQPNLFVGLP